MLSQLEQLQYKYRYRYHQHQHGWVAKQQLSIDVEQRISITAALETAQQRVVEALESQPAQTVDFKELPTKQEQKAA